MASSNSYDNSWADQWDYNNDPEPPIRDSKKKTSGAKFSSKVGNGLDKTKAVAFTGVKKVKQGASTGFSWIKDKYQKTTQKH